MPWHPYWHNWTSWHRPPTCQTHYWRRPPSRFFWFVAGALSAAAFISRCKDPSDPRFQHHCRRPSLIDPPSPNSEGPETRQYWQWRKRWEWQYPPQPHEQQAPPQPTVVNTPSTSPWDRPWGWGLTQAQQEKLWQEEVERMQKVAKQAGEAMSELSESTLDSVLKAVEALTDKLAAHSEARKRHQEKLEKELEEMRKNPPKLV